MLGRLKSMFGLGGRPPTPPTPPTPPPAAPASPAAQTSARPRVQARYDNAQPTDENRRSFWMADYLSPKAANSFSVRRLLRARSRYEVSNNPYLFGVAANNADDLISTGPTLQVTTSDPQFNALVERLWADYWAEVAGVEKLKTQKLARTIDGEGFLVFKTVEELESPVKLYPCDVEADQVTTPQPLNMGDFWVDGLTLHPVTGRPTGYHVLKHHPGDLFFPDANPLAVEKVQAKHVIHNFVKFRPGQVRGVPVFTPSLDLFVELRSFRKSVVTAARIAANHAAVMTTKNLPANTEGTEQEEYEPLDRIPLEVGMTVLPAGYELTQLDPKQPGTSYDSFQEKCLGEAIRPLSYPLNLALGTSQKFNFSSSKLDIVNYRSSLDVERRETVRVVLKPWFAAFVEEAILAGALPRWVVSIRDIPHEWHWPGYPVIDPFVDAQADHARLSNGTLTWRAFWASRGYDWRDVMRQQAAERKEIERLKLVFGEPAKRTADATATPDPEVANAA